ncbi:uncharacterized protein LOC144651673 [Oculina patagonica]
MSVAAIKNVIVVASFLLICNNLPSCGAASEFCFASICEFTFVVSEGRSMTFTTEDGSKSHDVKLEENGTLKLAPNLWYTQVPNITLTPDMVHTADGTAQRNIILVNGQFPGPTLEVMEGAEVAVNVVNDLLKEGLTIHWHGIHLRNNVWMDGVPYVTQCPILPRQSFTYRFIANPPGTHWYHSHNELQRVDGLFGALIVRRSKEKFMLPPHFPMVINDWFPFSSTEVDLLSPFRNSHGGNAESLFLSPDKKGSSLDGVELTSMDYWSGLINGRGRKGNNTAPLTVFDVTRGKKYRLHIVMASGEFAYRVSIDSHELTVIESDGNPAEPTTFESVIIYPGETYVVEFEADQNPGRYWIRASTLRVGSGFENPLPDGIVWDVKAILNYEEASDKKGDPKSKRRDCTSEAPCKVLNCPWPSYRQDLFPNTQCVAFSELRLDSSRYEGDISLKNEEVDLELFLNLAFPIGSSINSRRMVMPRAPLFQESSTWQLVPCTQDCAKTGCRCSNVVSLPANKTIQLVLMSDIFGGFQEGTVPGSESKAHHPMHLHGYSFRVLKTAYPIVDNITGKILGGNKDIVCNWREDKTCSHPYWNSGSATGLNFDKPPLKDTLLVPAMGYTVVRFRTDNPGYWLFHCHAMLHFVEGMTLIFNVSYEDHPPVPQGFPTCQNFDIGHEEFKKYLAQSQMSGEKDCGLKTSADEKQTSSNKITLVEALSAIAASCSSVSVLFQIILLVFFFKLYYRLRNHPGINKDENVAMLKISG